MKYNDLKNIYTIIEDELAQFEKKYSKILQSEVGLINKIGKYISKTKGKRLRPALLFLCAKYFGEIDEQVIKAGTIVELLHTATLIHDDVVDKSDQRRGRKSINSLWENKIAVLMGDFLFSRSLRALVDLENLPILREMSKTTEHLSSGELLQIEKSMGSGMTEEIYNDMIFYKTASLFATSCKIGAKLMNASQDLQDAFYDYGKYLGMAFQIKDDLFDIAGKREDTGKPVGLDVKQNILTLPVIYTLNNLPEDESNKIKKMIDSENAIKGDELDQYVHQAGGFKYCRKRVDYFSEKSKESLKHLPENESKTVLTDLVEYNKIRKR